MQIFDEIDYKIINILQENARTKRGEIAEKVGLTISAVSERLKKIEDRGLIKGYKTDLDFKIAGYDIMAFIFVFMESSKFYSTLKSKIVDEPEILECYAITGEGSHLLKVIAKDTYSLEKLLSRVQAWQGVTGTKTDIVLSEIKKSNKIKLVTNIERKQ